MPDQWDPTPREFIEARDEMTVNNYAQYCSVVKTGIGKAKMIIGGEVDAGKQDDWNRGTSLKATQSGTVNQIIKMSLSTG